MSDYAVKEAQTDNIANVRADHEELWIYGTSLSTEVWRNIGNPDFPFQRDPGAIIHQGCVAQWSPCSIQNGVVWLGGDTRGQAVAWFASGFQPVRISNHAVEREWSQYPTCADAVAYNYTERGHSFWVVSFPSANTTWCWDAITNMWHKRAWWNGTTYQRQRGMFHAYEFSKHLVGDYQNGKIYWMDKTLFQDDGVDIHFARTTPYLATELDRFSIDELRLDYLYDPALTITLKVSYDGARTFTAAKPPSGLKVNKDNAAIIVGCCWRRLGQSRPRIFLLEGYGMAARQLINGYLNPQETVG
jgi:hypothetical protein